MHSIAIHSPCLPVKERKKTKNKFASILELKERMLYRGPQQVRPFTNFLIRPSRSLSLASSRHPAFVRHNMVLDDAPREN
jgi:hypothetical protein